MFKYFKKKEICTPIENINEYRLKILLLFSNEIIRTTEPSSIFAIIKMLTDKIAVTSASKHDIHDFSLLYDRIRFDGAYYRLESDDRILGVAGNFELGCIFEIGRLLLRNGIHFKNAEYEK